MSYIDETYGKQLEEALRGLVSRPALGQPWFGFHASEVPVGVLLFTATTHSRVLYADFWKYIQDKNLVKTEEEWQSIYSEQGWCPFYSDGDGIDTFRMPSAPLYLYGANTLSEAGKYIEAGLPNLAGSFDTDDRRTHIKNATGVFYASVADSNKWSEISSATGNTQGVGFDASRANPIYGNSDTVTPETSKMLFGVWAISAPQQPIPDATVEGIISELSEAKEGLNGVVRSVNGVSADTVGNVAISIPATPEAYIVETWRDGAQWYNVYSNGFIEQGGIATGSKVAAGATISLPKEFKTTDYTLKVQVISKFPLENASTSTWVKTGGKTSTSFKATTGYTGTASSGLAVYSFSWIAKGY